MGSHYVYVSIGTRAHRLQNIEIMDNIFSKNIVRLLFLLSLLIYLTVGSILPDFLVGTIVGEALLWPMKLVELVKNIALSIAASCVFYYFIVYMPEQKQKISLNKLIDT